MRIDCLHGYFKFQETEPGEAGRFVDLFGLELEACGDIFVLKGLSTAPSYSLNGGKYMNADAIATHQGDPWEVMEANELVYDLQTGLIVPRSSVKVRIDISQAGKYYVAKGLINPGSLDLQNNRIHSYRCWFSFKTYTFRYSRIDYV